MVLALALVLISIALIVVSGCLLAVLWLNRRQAEDEHTMFSDIGGRIDKLIGDDDLKNNQIKIIKKKESQPFEKDVLDKLDAEVSDQTKI